MDFELTDEQRMLKDSIDRLIAPAYDDLARRRRAQDEPPGYGETLWAKYAELGLLGLPFAEADGGFGGGTVETMLVMEAVGRGLALEPYLPCIVLAGGLVRLAGTNAQRDALVPAIADGTTRPAFAHVERQARYDTHDVGTIARREGDGWVLEGDKSIVLAGDAANLLIVSARTSGSRHTADGITLFLVDPRLAGVSRRGFSTQDGLRGAAVSLASVRLGADAVLGAVDGAGPAIDHAIDVATAAVAAEAVGAMAALHALTVDYLKTRRQFGVAISAFQALQHRAVDMFTALEAARSMACYAAMMADEPDPRLRRAAISAAKIQVNNAARFVGQQAVQLHGGIGVTMEYRAGHYFKRLTMIEGLFGDSAHHMRRLDAAGGLSDAA